MPYYLCPACGRTCYSSAGHSPGDECPSCSAPLPASSQLGPRGANARGASSASDGAASGSGRGRA
jgi:hypothetical protein